MVEVWSWIIGYAILFAVVQLAIYAYYVRRGDARPRASATGGDDYRRVGDRVTRDPLVEDDDLDDTPPRPRHLDDETMRACPHCGTPNDTTTTIKYCRNCTRSLG